MVVKAWKEERRNGRVVCGAVSVFGKNTKNKK
jgi:hypothetical protein